MTTDEGFRKIIKQIRADLDKDIYYDEEEFGEYKIDGELVKDILERINHNVKQLSILWRNK